MSLNLAFTPAPPVSRSFLGRIADLGDRALQQLVLLFFYYLPLPFALLDPVLRRGDVRRTYAGSSRFQSGRYAIYVLWQPGGTIPWYARNLLKELRDRHVDTIAVLNHPPTPEQLGVLQDLCAEILIRGNKGSDFGAYKDAVLHLTRENKTVSRLLLLNDSVYVFPRGLKDLVAQLLSDEHPVTAAYECWERLYHLQSFCIGLAGTVLYHPEVQAFWEGYRPIATRRWRIDQGEVELSAALRKASPRFKVVYGINQLLASMTSGDDWTSILKHREYVPRPLRHLFPSDNILSVLREADPAERELLLQRLKESLSDLLMFRAQAHTGAFLFPKFLASPFLKRDLVYREQFTLYEVERMLSELGFGEYRERIADEIRRRGSAGHLQGVARRKYRLNLT